jgi:hypothetical protein
MICQPCKNAGRHLAAGDKEFAWKSHGRCPAIRKDQRTLCDCQHVTKSVIRQEAKREG